MDNFLLTVWQSEFLIGHSIVIQWIKIHSKFCKAVSEGKEIKVCFFSTFQKLSTEFGIVEKLEKLSNVGIDGRLLQLFTSYLTDIIQHVIINGQTSK